MAHSPENMHVQSQSPGYGRAFAIGIGLNVVFVAVEIFFGLRSNSSALLADAGHNASDVFSLLFAWTAAWLATIAPRGKYTYGLRKTTILVSILNALLLFGAVALIALNAVRKLRDPEPIAGTQIMIVAGIGFFINAITALLFMKGQKEDLNIRGAFLHMAADASVSLGVVGAGFLINLTGKEWIDPVTSFLIITVILWGTWRLFTDSIDLALDAVPKNISIDKVRDFLLARNGVTDIHDLHIWAMSTTRVALTAHLIMPRGSDDGFIAQLQKELKREFGISHTTFQIENVQIEKDCSVDC